MDNIRIIINESSDLCSKTSNFREFHQLVAELFTQTDFIKKKRSRAFKKLSIDIQDHQIRFIFNS